MAKTVSNQPAETVRSPQMEKVVELNKDRNRKLATKNANLQQSNINSSLGLNTSTEINEVPTTKTISPSELVLAKRRAGLIEAPRVKKPRSLDPSIARYDFTNFYRGLKNARTKEARSKVIKQTIADHKEFTRNEEIFQMALAKASIGI